MSTCLWNNLHAFKTNSSDILFYSSSIAVLSKPIFGWQVAFVLFSKTLHIAKSRCLRSGLRSCLIAVLTVFLWTFNSFVYFLINVVGSSIAVVRAVKKPYFCFLLNLPLLYFLKSSFSVNFFFCFVYDRQRNFDLTPVLSKS